MDLSKRDTSDFRLLENDKRVVVYGSRTCKSCWLRLLSWSLPGTRHTTIQSHSKAQMLSHASGNQHLTDCASINLYHKHLKHQEFERNCPFESGPRHSEAPVDISNSLAHWRSSWTLPGHPGDAECDVFDRTMRRWSPPRCC